MFDTTSTACRSLALAASFGLSACSTSTPLCERPPVAPELTEPCPDLVLASEIGWMEAHKQNMKAYAECRIQYQALVEAVTDEADP